MLLLLPILAILTTPALWLMLGRARFLTGESGPVGEAAISVIIPARNEEETLELLLESLRREVSDKVEIIVVDDDSQDRTASIARDYLAKVVVPEPLPSDWKGKPWACQTGAKAATGDWLFFLDADVVLEPGGWVQIERLAHRGGAVFSICPFHKIESGVEEFSAFFNTIMAAGSNAFGFGKASGADSALFGQSLLISREHYEEVEGHSRVRNEVLENFHLAEHLKALAIPRECFLGRGALSMRMFTGGLSQLWASWKKGFTSGAKQAAPRALILISIWLTSGMLLLTNLLLILFGLSDAAFIAVTAGGFLLYAIQCVWAFRLVGRFSVWTALLFPLGLIFYQTLFFTALVERSRGKNTQWKGRNVG